MNKEQNQSGAPVLQDFTLEEQQQILKAAGTIRLADPRGVSAYGVGAQKHLEEVNRQIAAFAAARAPEKTTALLQELMEALQQAGVANNEPKKGRDAGKAPGPALRESQKALEPALRKVPGSSPGPALHREPEKIGFFQRVGRLWTKKPPAEETNLPMPDREETEVLLIQHQEQLLRDRAACRQLTLQNEKYLKELSMYIAAGYLALHAEGETAAPAECSRFEKRLQDLMITRAAALQSAAQLQLLQENAEQLWGELQTVEKLTLPLFQSRAGHTCPVCGQHRFSRKGSYEICPVCGWEDDPVQERDPDFSGGANRQSLREYRAAFANKK
ncbi:MAG: toxic anion resistance protein [Anaerovoracaceae bacterium]